MALSNKKKIFISYRVNDTQAATGRLVDGLKLHFDDEQIFMDIEKIEPGLDFTEVIPKYLNASDIVLAIIGPEWSGYNREKGTSRILDENDWVRREIASALEQKIRVVPVLLQGGTIPSEENLPDDLKLLVRRQAFEITNKRWKYDSDQLTDFLKKTLNQPEVSRPGNNSNDNNGTAQNRNHQQIPVPPVENKNRKIWIILASVFGLLILIKLMSGDYGNANNNLGNYPNNNEMPQPSPDDNKPVPEVQPLQNNPPAAPEIKNIAGKWFDPNGKGTFILTQNGENISMQAYSLAGEQTGSGSGFVKGKNVNIQATIYLQGNAIPCEIQNVLSDDERTMNGVIKIQDKGASYTEKIILEKQ